jgi:histidyl-tRNA synthetase
MNKPQPISGFPELLPAQQIAANHIMDKVRKHFESFGFVPLDTPAIERSSTLLAKGAAEHEIYGINRLLAKEGEVDKKEMALRFDLTVPLARYVAQHYGQLTFPFRRYHLGAVWRGERPKVGRYRQFYQCDIDVIGDGELPLAYDAEVASAMCRLFRDLEIGGFRVRLNNRKVLQGYFASFGLESTEEMQAALRTVDDLEKLPRADIEKELANLLDEKAIAEVLEFFSEKHDTAGWLSKLEAMNLNDVFNTGVAELKEVAQSMRDMGAREDEFEIDPTIARGLGYYTGTIYETRLNDYPELGSICSGGRYENLAGNFTNKNLPGVGISLGFSRLILPLMEKGVFDCSTSSTASVLVTSQNPDLQGYYLKIATKLRNSGINTENYLEDRKLNGQMKYANKRGFKIAVIADVGEKDKQEVIVKNLISGEQKEVALDNLVDTVQAEMESC